MTTESTETERIKTPAIWQTARRAFDYADKTLIMGILNVTPDSFSDGGQFSLIDAALRQAELMIGAGADILDIGGESTRPNAERVSTDEEMRRVLPVITEILRRFKIAISIDTTRSTVAQAAIEAGAEIINDISGLRFDSAVATVAASSGAGLVLMHSRGDFEEMHRLKTVEQVLPEVIADLHRSAVKASDFGVKSEQIAFDIGIGFGKTFLQNLELLANLDEICHNFNDFPILVGTSRKSFLGKILNDAPVSERIYGTVASTAIAIFNGADIVRVHDVAAAVDAARVAKAIRNNKDRHDQDDKL